jgi:hypothetical protein
MLVDLDPGRIGAGGSRAEDDSGRGVGVPATISGEGVKGVVGWDGGPT